MKVVKAVKSRTPRKAKNPNKHKETMTISKRRTARKKPKNQMRRRGSRMTGGNKTANTKEKETKINTCIFCQHDIIGKQQETGGNIVMPDNVIQITCCGREGYYVHTECMYDAMMHNYIKCPQCRKNMSPLPEPRKSDELYIPMWSEECGFTEDQYKILSKILHGDDNDDYLKCPRYIFLRINGINTDSVSVQASPKLADLMTKQTVYLKIDTFLEKLGKLMVTIQMPQNLKKGFTMSATMIDEMKCFIWYHNVTYLNIEILENVLPKIPFRIKVYSMQHKVYDMVSTKRVKVFDGYEEYTEQELAYRPSAGFVRKDCSFGSKADIEGVTVEWAT
jgi:hypothetical protein